MLLQRKLSTGIVLLLMLLSAGLGYAMSVLNSKPIKDTLAKDNTLTEAAHTKYLNPVLPFAENLQLDFAELKSFKSRLEKDIQAFHLQNPNVQVSYYFRDLNNGLWTGIGEREMYCPASLFKLPLLIAVLKKSEEKPEILDLGFTFHASDFAGVEEESGFAKEEGKFYTVKDLMQQMISYSDNGAALMLLNILGDSALLRVMNDLNFHVEKGFNENTEFVNVKTFAALFRVLYNGSYLSQANSSRVLQMLSESVYAEGIRKAIPAAISMAHKYGKRDLKVGSGLQNLQLHHFALVYHPRKPFIIGIMTRGGNQKQKEELIENLTRITWEEVEQQSGSRGFHGMFAE